MNSSKILSRLVIRRFAPQARKAHDGHHDKYALKAARCYLEGHKPYTDDASYALPFVTDNPYKLWLRFFIYFASGFWMPFASYHYARVGSLR